MPASQLRAYYNNKYVIKIILVFLLMDVHVPLRFVIKLQLGSTTAKSSGSGSATPKSDFTTLDNS